MKQKKANTAMWIIIFALVVFVAGISAYLIAGSGGVKITTQTAAGGGTQATQTTTVVASGCNQNPAYTYSAIDAFSSSTAIGSSNNYTKLGDDAPVSALASPTLGKTMSFWVENTTAAMCELVDATGAVIDDSSKAVNTVQCGSHLVQTKCYRNSTVTLAVVNTAGAQTSLTDTGGANNLTLAANGVANLRIDYTGTAKRPFMPLGGCLAVEYPTNVSSISLSGSGISSSVKCPYAWTYTTVNSNTYAKFAVPKGFDVDGKGDQKSITFQMQAGSNGVGEDQVARVTWQPANYYVTNDGRIILGIEKDQNQDITKTYGSGTTFTVRFSRA